MSTMLDSILAFQTVRAVVLGDVMLDRYVIGDARRISPEAPIPVINVLRETTMLGGAGNVALNIAHMGGRAVLVGVRGDDEDGGRLAQVAACEPRLEPMLVVTPTRPTTVKSRFVAHGQQLLRADRENTEPVAGVLEDEVVSVLASALRACTVLVVSDYAKGVLSDGVLSKVMALARQCGCPVLVDPKRVDMRAYAGATIVTPNAHEAAATTGICCDDDDGAVAAARRIGAMVGCRHVVITRGERGLTILDVAPDVATHIAAERREVHDVSGAGDSVVAALALAIGSGAPLEAAARLANIAGSIAVSKAGTAAVGAEEMIFAVQSHCSGDAKIVSLEAAARLAGTWREQGRRIVLTNGCFDILHPGHVRLIQRARGEGDKLIVAINSDASTRRLKGAGRPVHAQTARALVMSALSAVDLVLIFDEDTPLAAIEAILPDVLVKGADYAVDEVVGGDVVIAHGGRVVLVPLEPGHSTTAAIDKAVRGVTMSGQRP